MAMRFLAIGLAFEVSGCALFSVRAVPNEWVGAPAGVVDNLWPGRSLIKTTTEDGVEIRHFLDSYFGSSGNCLLVIGRTGDGVFRGTMTYEGYRSWHDCAHRSGTRGCEF